MLILFLLFLFFIAIGGGIFVHPILFAILLLVVIVALVGPAEGGGYGRRRW